MSITQSGLASFLPDFKTRRKRWRQQRLKYILCTRLRDYFYDHFLLLNKEILSKKSPSVWNTKRECETALLMNARLRTKPIRRRFNYGESRLHITAESQGVFCHLWAVVRRRVFLLCPARYGGKALSFLRALIILGIKLLMFHRSAAIGHKLTSAPGDMAHRAAAMYCCAAGRLENCKTDVHRGGERGQKNIRQRKRDREIERERER